MFNQQTQSIRDFIRLINKIATDDSFERPYGCWAQVNRNGFIQDVFGEISSTAITLAETNSCRHFAEEYEDRESEAYFARFLARNKFYVSLDGKHRTECIKAFINNEFSFTGITVDDDGNKVRVRNKFFKDLSPSVRNNFLNCRVPLTIFQDVQKRTLPRIFLSLNANESLTKQHKRNALQTPFAPKTRELVSEYKNLFTTLFGVRSLALMIPHEFVSKVYVHCTDSSGNVGQAVLNTLYLKGVDLQWREVYDSVAWKKTENIINLINSINSEISLSKVNLLLMVLVCEKIVDEKMIISNLKTFVETISLLDIELEKQSRAKETQDAKKGATNLSNYYFEQKRVQWNQHCRKTRQDTLWKVILKNLAVYSISEKKEQAA